MHSLLNKDSPAGNVLKEIAYSSKSDKYWVDRYDLNKNLLNNSITLGNIAYYAHRKDRLLHGSRCNVSKE